MTTLKSDSAMEEFLVMMSGDFSFRHVTASSPKEAKEITLELFMGKMRQFIEEDARFTGVLVLKSSAKREQ